MRDWGIVAAVAVLSVFGFTGIASLYAGTGDARLWRHGAAVLLGFVLMLAVGRFRSHHLRTAALPLYAVCLGMMVLVLFVGTEVRGTKGWILAGPLTLQPVEFMKLGLVLMLASYFARARLRAHAWERVAQSALLAAPPVALTLLQPDVGSAFVLVFIWVLLLMPLLSWRERGTMAAAALVMCVIGWFFLFQSHHRERIKVLLNPSRDPFGTGYNIRQSIIAVGSGKLAGRGVGAGSQSQLQFLPEAATDFAFALIAEEMGFIGSMALLLAFAALFGRIIGHLPRAPDEFAAFALAGIGGWWFTQASVYIAMNVGLAPVVGIPLPFVSYGGSALLSSFLAAGCVQAACGESSVPRDA